MKWLQAAVVAVLVSGCGGATSLSLSVRAGAPRTGAQAQLAQRLEVASGVDIDRVRILIRDLELEPLEGKDDSEEDDEEIEAGPFLVDLSGAALAGDVQKVLEADVPAGRYRKVKFKIDTLEEDETALDASFDALREQQASVLIEGTVDGEAFSFAAELDVEQEFEADLGLDAGAGNLTLNVDPTGWFTAADGSRLDPRLSESRAKIVENLKHSLDVVEDHDRDGDDDSHESED